MKIVAISGSLRRASSNAAILKALELLIPHGSTFAFYQGLGSLPHFNPDLDGEGDVPPPAVAELRDLLASSDGVVISSPEYAHGVPGSLKNMLDWLVSDGTLVDKPVVLINAAPAGGEYAQTSLAETLRTMNWNVLTTPGASDPFVKVRGRFDDPTVTQMLQRVIDAIAERAEAGQE